MRCLSGGPEEGIAKSGEVMIKFEHPLWLVAATFFVVLILWCKEPPGSLRAYKLAEITDRIPNESVRYWIQLSVFLIIGTFAALALTNPSKVSQAFAAGLGWTAGLSGRTTGAHPKKSRVTAAGTQPAL